MHSHLSSMDSEHTFGYWLRLKRKSQDQTREDLVRLVGCSPETIRKIESEERRPSAQIVERLAAIFKIPAAEQKSFLAFARGDWQAAPARPVDDIPWQAQDGHPRTNLPSMTTSLIGREQDIANVRAYLRDSEIRLVNLIGPPGIGKTRLGLAAARAVLPDFPGGIFFVPLAALDRPDFIGTAMLQSLGIVETKGLQAVKLLADGIGQRRMLLVLDDCEQVIDAVAAIVTDLLAVCPNLKFLLTSREALRVPGEWRYTLSALKVPEKSTPVRLETAAEFPALTLFTERACSVQSDFCLDSGNLAAVTTICSQVDGLPLAIELLASRMRFMSPQALLERMSDQYLLSADGMRSIPARQKTLENAIRWSYDHLQPVEQKVLTYLAVFQNSLILKTAENALAEIAAGQPIADVVVSLLDKSLLQRTQDENGEIRFAMLATIRKFGMDRLRRVGNESHARNLHLAFFLRLAETGDREVHGPDQAQWINQIDSEHDNFRAALDWSIACQNPESALRLLAALGWPWEVRGYFREARFWLDQIRALPGLDRCPLHYARALNHVGRYEWILGNSREARALLEESRSVAMNAGPECEPVLAETLNWMGLVALLTHQDQDAGRAWVQQGLALYQKWGIRSGITLSTFHLGLFAREMGDIDLALRLQEQSLALFKQDQDLFFIARVSTNIATTLFLQGRHDLVLPYLQEHLRIDRELQYWDGMADAFHNLGNYYWLAGDLDEASRHFEQSLEVCLEHGTYTLNALQSSAMLAYATDRFEQADARFRLLLEGAHRIGETDRVAVALLGLAATAARANQMERTARLNGAALAITDLNQSVVLDSTRFSAALQVARDQLGDQRFTELQNVGRAMPHDQALDYALEMARPG